MSSPSIVPDHDGLLYFVLKDFGQYGTAFIETDPVENSRAAVIEAIACGELDNIVQVLEVDLGAGRAVDVTQEIFAAAGASAGTTSA